MNPFTLTILKSIMILSFPFLQRAIDGLETANTFLYTHPAATVVFLGTCECKSLFTLSLAAK